MSLRNVRVPRKRLANARRSRNGQRRRDRERKLTGKQIGVSENGERPAAERGEPAGQRKKGDIPRKGTASRNLSRRRLLTALPGHREAQRAEAVEDA
ncbi:MAG: hypothetical protein OXL97_07775 [Chloroflexota bacterium]|nr:hypothetical protein [Chloroflexota bacterium]MDE2883795.1 hypothetical protein [Chloroflexota bacterium]